MPFKLSDYNALLDEVNNVLENPPNEHCDAVEAIPHVTAPHRWAKSDIRTIHEKLIETCDEIEFDEIDGRWRQSTIDEIRSKFSQAWCDCRCSPEQVAAALEGIDGTIWQLFSTDKVYKNPCLGNCTPTLSFDARTLLSGFQFAPPGFIGVIAILEANATSASVSSFLNSHPECVNHSLAGHPTNYYSQWFFGVGCDGKINFEGFDSPILFPLESGIRSNCATFPCGSGTCQSIISSGQANLVDFLPVTYRLRMVVEPWASCCSSQPPTDSEGGGAPPIIDNPFVEGS